MIRIAAYAAAMDYPYGSRQLKPAWSNNRSRRLAVFAVLSGLLALALRWPLALAAADDIALRIVLPATLAFVLAFAPLPGTRVGRALRDLTVLGLALSVFAGDYVPLMVALYPLVLAASVAIGESRLGGLFWGAKP